MEKMETTATKLSLQKEINKRQALEIETLKKMLATLKQEKEDLSTYIDVIYGLNK